MIPANPYDEPELPLVSIGAAAQVLGISINLLRFYEAEGLILPARTDKNQRRYSRADLARVQCLRHAIQEEGMTIAAIKRMMAMIPCWEIRQCSDRDRKHCDAFRGIQQPCWAFKHSRNLCAEEECRACPVYRLSSDCNAIKTSIINSTIRS